MIKRGPALSTRLKNLVNNALSGSAVGHTCILCLDRDKSGTSNGGFCIGCRSDLPVQGPCCVVCALPLPVPGRCGRCQQQPPAFDRVRVAFAYEFPLNAMVTRFKYSGDKTMAYPLIAALAEHLREGDSRPDLIIPCPIHPQRLRKRGFNQAAIIASALGVALDVAVDYRLCRRRQATPPQTGLNREARLRNLRHAFVLKRTPPERVAVVDDVVTTGATAHQIARVLKAGGAKEVEIWALARTP